jgi:hypothetical protein
MENPIIDVVYIWVDGLDPRHIEKRYKYLSPNSTITNTNRWMSMDEITLSVLSVKKYLPWVRNVYVISDEQEVPLKIRDDVIQINHKDIIPSEMLPVFNSHALESRIHVIHGLSELFIYFNDDMMIGGEMSPSDFYSSDGRPKVFLDGIDISQAGSLSVDMMFDKNMLTPSSSNENMEPWRGARMNNGVILNMLYGPKHRRDVGHQCKPITKSIMNRPWEIIETRDKMVDTLKTKFRSVYDVYPLGLALWIALEEGNCIVEKPKKHKFFMIFDHTNINDTQLDISSSGYYMYCINDDRLKYEEKHCEEYKEMIHYLISTVS